MHADPYHFIKMHENELNQDEIICDVCLEDDDFEGDEIVICDLCLGATHQSCYGGEIKNRLPPPNQPWYCARCQELVKNKTKRACDIKCALCPDLKGLMKPLNLGSTQKEWAHLICVNWTPEIWFTNDNNDEIDGKINKSRHKLRCGKCMKISGSCVQCDFQGCKRSWHVRCAAKC